MFLRGELEQQAAEPAPAEVSPGSGGGAGAGAPAAPAWGSRPAAPPAPASLKQILDQEAASVQASPLQQGSASKPPTPAARVTPGSGERCGRACSSPA